MPVAAVAADDDDVESTMALRLRRMLSGNGFQLLGQRHSCSGVGVGVGDGGGGGLTLAWVMWLSAAADTDGCASVHQESASLCTTDFHLPPYPHPPIRPLGLLRFPASGIARACVQTHACVLLSLALVASDALAPIDGISEGHPVAMVMVGG